MGPIPDGKRSGAPELQTKHKGRVEQRRRGSACAAACCVCSGLQNLAEAEIQKFFDPAAIFSSLAGSAAPQLRPGLISSFHGHFSVTRLHVSQPLTWEQQELNESVFFEFSGNERTHEPAENGVVFLKILYQKCFHGTQRNVPQPLAPLPAHVRARAERRSEIRSQVVTGDAR